MDFRAALILVCMLFARASCQPVRNKTTVWDSTSTEQMMKDIQKVLDDLSAPELLPNISCCSLNMTKPPAQPVTDQIPTFRCYMQKFSENKDLAQDLKPIEQIMQDMERQLTGQIGPKNCILPIFKNELESLNCAKCFLQLVQKTLTNPKL